MIEQNLLLRRRPTARVGLVAAVAAVAFLAGLVGACGGGSGPQAAPTSGPASGTASATGPTSTLPSASVWLCRPGLNDDPCASDVTAAAVTSSGATTTEPAPRSPPPAVDCFYIYGTVSTETTLNADLKIQPAEIDAAVGQASRFSSVCRVWAPIYRQVTVRALLTGHAIDPSVLATAYSSLAQAWTDYLSHDNDGRPIVFIGHSQGAAMLTMLLRNQVDNDPQLRSRLISAIVLGGNVTVPVGKDVGGTFAHIPTCQSPTQTGCVIAYSTPSTPPPANSLLGIPGQGVSLQSHQTAKSGLQVVCVNPGAVGATGQVPLHPYFPVTGSPAWATYPGLYTGQCERRGDASWLQVDTAKIPGDRRPKVSPDLGPTWGLHVYDANLALGDLINDVGQQESSRLSGGLRSPATG
jgi:hypothetical protein